MLTRRQFLSRTGAATAAALLGPSLWRHPSVRSALADTIGDRFFIVLFMNGGNDGLNTVVPLADGTSGTLRTFYQQVRRTGVGGIQIAPANLAATAIGNDPNTGTPLGLHPGLIGLKHLYDAGHVAVIQGCGYPDYSLSHAQSRLTWQTATLRAMGTGWVGRYLMAAGYGGTDIAGVNISGSVADEFQQAATSVLALYNLDDYTFPYDYWYMDDAPAKRACFEALYAQSAASLQSAVKYAGTAGSATLNSTDVYPNAASLYESDRSVWDGEYAALDTGTARGLREIAKVIYGVSKGLPGVAARHFQLSNGGYDTHSDQGAETGRHYDLHREVGDAIELFYNDCADMGVANKVCLLTWSEFSRRVLQNDSGTDHGSQGPMFIVGGGVHGNVFGNHPNIDPTKLNDDGNTPYTQRAANPARSTDFRDVYGTILKHWLQMPEATILDPLNPVLELDAGNPDDYWTARNFDMGFI